MRLSLEDRAFMETALQNDDATRLHEWLLECAASPAFFLHLKAQQRGVGLLVQASKSRRPCRRGGAFRVVCMLLREWMSDLCPQEIAYARRAAADCGNAHIAHVLAPHVHALVDECYDRHGQSHIIAPAQMAMSVGYRHDRAARARPQNVAYDDKAVDR